MPELSNQEIQNICDLIQSGEKTEDYFPVSNRMYMGKWYYHVVMIYGTMYMVNVKREILFD